jgi:hypothetical protein
LFVECGLFVEGVAEGVLGHFEVVFDHHEGVLQYILEDLHLLLDVY